MRITGARVAFSATTSEKVDLWLDEDRISFSPIQCSPQNGFDLSGYMILPGLINSHDHLELNLFPKLGCGIYPNATVWASDIYQPHKSPIKEQITVPMSVRLRWGAIKNLLSGVTTVAHHNPLPSPALRRKLPVRILSKYGWAHSLHFSPDWQRRFQATPVGHPFVIHASEGTDEWAAREIKILKEAGGLTNSTVLIHGVGMGPKELVSVAESRSSLIWCPSSNHFTLGRTVDREILNSDLPIALGTDSALTSDGDLLDELRFASATVSPERLYGMITSTAAQILKLPPAFGKVCDGGPADLLIVRDNGFTPAKTLLSATPQAVIVKGRFELVSASFPFRNVHGRFNERSQLNLENRGTYFLRMSPASLLKRTREILGCRIRLAGKLVA